MQQDWQPAECNERSGFLFKHRCDRRPIDSCAVCQKPVCADHSHDRDEGLVCTSCAKSKLQRQRGQRRYNRDRHYYNDPYFYGGYHYNGYGHYGHGYWGHRNYESRHHNDPNDFTEADGASMAYENEGEDFESDMGES